MKIQDVGLRYGDVTRIARRCRASKVYVWLVAQGQRNGRPSIVRALKEAGWTGPPATVPTEAPTERAMAARALAGILKAAHKD